MLIMEGYGIITYRVRSVISSVQLGCLQMKAQAGVLGQGKDTVWSNDTYLLKHIAPVNKKLFEWAHGHI